MDVALGSAHLGRRMGAGGGQGAWAQAARGWSAEKGRSDCVWAGAGRLSPGELSRMDGEPTCAPLLPRWWSASEKQHQEPRPSQSAGGVLAPRPRAWVLPSGALITCTLHPVLWVSLLTVPSAADHPVLPRFFDVGHILPFL